MYAFITRRKVTACRSHGGQLRALGSDQLYFCADRIPVALVADEFQSQPMVQGLRCITEDVKRPIITGYHSVHSSVIVDITDCQAASHPGFLKNPSSLR